MPGDAVAIGLRVRVRFGDPDPQTGARLPLFEAGGEEPA